MDDAPSTNIPLPLFNKKKPTTKRGIFRNKEIFCTCILNDTTFKKNVQELHKQIS